MFLEVSMSSEWFYLQQWRYKRYLREEAEKNKKANEEKEDHASTPSPKN